MATKKPKIEEKPLDTRKKPDGRKKNGGARPGTGGAMPGAGRPAFEPTEQERRQVEALSGYGLPLPQIAALIRDGIHVQTLSAHFEKELMLGKAKANAGAAKSIYQKVMSGDPGMMRYWGATQLGWRETQHHEVTGKDGAPIAIATLDVSQLGTEVLAQIMAAKDASDAS